MDIVSVKFTMIMHTKFTDNPHIRNTGSQYVCCTVYCRHIFCTYFFSVECALVYV
jgi:hypothetical protein